MTNYKMIIETDDYAELGHYVKGPAAHAALYEISQEIFRPARKHGYGDPRLETLAEGNEDLIEKLEAVFWRIVNERDLEL